MHVETELTGRNRGKAAAENGVSREVAEACLAHTVQGVEGAYFGSDVFELRSEVMEKWAAWRKGARYKCKTKREKATYRQRENVFLRLPTLLL